MDGLVFCGLCVIVRLEGRYSTNWKRGVERERVDKGRMWGGLSHQTSLGDDE